MDPNKRLKTARNGLATLISITALTALSFLDLPKQSKEVTYTCPTEYPVVTSSYGVRKARPHAGIDIRAYCGTKIFASAEGKVVFVEEGKNAGFGNSVIIYHPDGLYTHYAHLQDSSIRVKEGDYVVTGEQIALAGNTGLANMPCHLHFEVREEESYLREHLWKHDSQGNRAGVKPVEDWTVHINPEDVLPGMEHK
ncbi:MAG: M23 family metallopeptidase [archaeon]